MRRDGRGGEGRKDERDVERRNFAPRSFLKVGAYGDILVDCVKQLTMLPASPGRMTSAPPPRYEHPPPYHVGWTQGHGVPEEVLIHRPQDSSVIAGRREYLMSRPDPSISSMSYIILSCVVFWLCGFVFGAIAFVLAGLCAV